jgi:hypothetical protein
MTLTMTHRVSLVATLLAPLLATPALRAQEAPPAAVEVLAQGPVHEAFAQPVPTNPQPAPVIARQPPPPVPEEPPDQRPPGNNVQWIPGYWAWDAARNDYVWVSGIWRNIPPGETFVPGYWTQVPSGWQRVSGTWMDARRNELTYDPPPPASLENGPSVPAPDDSTVYVPGYWDYQQARFAWRPGYWAVNAADMVWVPAHYLWTPAGYVFVPGYWDYPLDQRGLLFAPAAFNQPLWQDPGYAYQPAYTVDPGALLDSLFVNPAANSYCFGDYYGAPGGYQPWILYGPNYFDPLFGFYNFQNHGNPGWARGLRRDFNDRLAGRAPRPPRTWGQQQALANRTAGRHSSGMLRPLTATSGRTNGLTHMSASQRQRQRAGVRSMQQRSASRRQAETRMTTAAAGSRHSTTTAFNLNGLTSTAGRRSTTVAGATAHGNRQVTRTPVPRNVGSRPAAHRRSSSQQGSFTHSTQGRRTVTWTTNRTQASRGMRTTRTQTQTRARRSYQPRTVRTTPSSAHSSRPQRSQPRRAPAAHGGGRHASHR